MTPWTQTQEQVIPEGLNALGWMHAGTGNEEWHPVEMAHVGGAHVGGTSHWSRGNSVGRKARQ